MKIGKDTIGIVGGMGPKAGIILMDKVLHYADAQSDQECPSTILMSFPSYIVDRTAFLEGSTTINPAYNIVKVIKKLESSGASVVGIACNTSYAPQIFNVIIEKMEELKSKVKIVNMPFEVCNYLETNHSTMRKVGLMTTNGAYKSGVYKNQLLEKGYEVIAPDHEFQNQVIHRMIYDSQFGIKSNSHNITLQAKTLFNEALNYFEEQEADAIILGCTELSLVNESVNSKMVMIDSLDVMAKALIREVGYNNKYRNSSYAATEQLLETP